MKTWIIAILLFGCVTAQAQAHPHVFITPKAVIMMNNHFLSQVNVEWDFDEMSSALYLESCGSDNNGIWNLIFPQTQLLADGRQAARSGYYTYVEIDGTLISNLILADFTSDFIDGNLRCRFTLNINQNVDKTFKIWFDDPTIYNAFDVQRGNFQVVDQSGTHPRLQKQTESDIDKICLLY